MGSILELNLAKVTLAMMGILVRSIIRLAL